MSQAHRAVLRETFERLMVIIPREIGKLKHPWIGLGSLACKNLYRITLTCDGSANDADNCFCAHVQSSHTLTSLWITQEDLMPDTWELDQLSCRYGDNACCQALQLDGLMISIRTMACRLAASIHEWQPQVWSVDVLEDDKCLFCRAYDCSLGNNLPNGVVHCERGQCTQAVWEFIHGAYACWCLVEMGCTRHNVLCDDVRLIISAILADMVRRTLMSFCGSQTESPVGRA